MNNCKQDIAFATDVWQKLLTLSGTWIRDNRFTSDKWTCPMKIQCSLQTWNKRHSQLFGSEKKRCVSLGTSDNSQSTILGRNHFWNQNEFLLGITFHSNVLWSLAKTLAFFTPKGAWATFALRPCEDGHFIRKVHWSLAKTSLSEFSRVPQQLLLYVAANMVTFPGTFTGP